MIFLMTDASVYHYMLLHRSLSALPIPESWALNQLLSQRALTSPTFPAENLGSESSH